MPRTSKITEIPWQGDHLVDYLRSHDLWSRLALAERGIEMRPNDPFEAVMRIDGISRGRSAANFQLINEETGGRATLFMVDLMGMIEEFGVPMGGVIHGWWKGCKYGTNYGLIYLGKETP